MLRAVHGILPASLRMLLTLAAFAFTLFAFQSYGHEMESEHVHCGENGQNCPQEEDVVRGYRLVTPNSSPTPYTGAIMTEVISEAWCSVVGDYAKEVAAAGGCTAFCAKKYKGSARKKAVCVAACVPIVTTASSCD